MQVFTGIYPALVTPSSPDQTVNVPVLRELVTYLVDKGVDGFYVGGTTGEGIYMPVPQRKILVESVMTHLAGALPVIVHVGAASVDDAVDLAQHAQQHGAVAVSSVIPPAYTALDAIAHYYHQLAAAAPDLPFLAYILNPQINALALMERLASIPNLGGTKYTGPNMSEFRQILDLGAGRAWTMFSGMDEQCLYAAMMGATGAIGSTINMMPGVYKQIYAHVLAGDYVQAQTLQVQANAVTNAMLEVGFAGSLKAILGKLIGHPMGAPRLPNLPISAEQEAQLWAQLAQTEYEALVAL